MQYVSIGETLKKCLGLEDVKNCVPTSQAKSKLHLISDHYIQSVENSKSLPIFKKKVKIFINNNKLPVFYNRYGKI